MMAQANPHWVRNGWGHRVTTVDSLMRAVSRIGTLQRGRRYVWRGMPNYKWPVQSALYRWLLEVGVSEFPSEKEVRSWEAAILDRARSWGIDVELGPSATDLHMLALLQHHGLPTRLVDVTDNPMTALWFACQPSGNGGDTTAALVAIDVTGICEYGTYQPWASPTYAMRTSPLSWSLHEALADSAARNVPFLVRPTLPDARMRAQEGLFISGAVPDGPPASGVQGFPLLGRKAPGASALRTLFSPEERKRGRPRGLPFCVLTITTPLKGRVLEHLADFHHKTERRLFPDVDGLRQAFERGNLNLQPIDEDLLMYPDVAGPLLH